MTVDIPEPPTQQVLANAPDQHVQIGLAINDVETLVTAEYIGAPGPTGPTGPTGESVTTYVQATAPDPALVALRVGDFWVRKPPAVDPQPMFTWDGSAWVAIYGKPGADGVDGTDGADGVGVPSGGTTGQMLTKASDIDYESTWTDLPPVSIVVPPATGGMSADKFRGLWATDEIVKHYDFSGGVLPDGFTTSTVGTGLTPTLSTVAAAGAASPPPGYTYAVKFASPQLNGTWRSNLTIDLATLGIPNISRATVWWGCRDYINNTENYLVGSLVINEIVVSSAREPTTWTQIQAGCDANDILTLRGQSDYNAVVGFSTDEYATGLTLYGSVPYMIDQYVIYNGVMYRSTADYNSHVPDTLIGWVKVPLATGVLLLETGGTVPAGTPVGTIIFEKA